jgi:predicted nucleic acid-binding protein
LIVYVETNFVLELAYLRSTSDDCQRLLNLAGDGKISLVVPAFALIEARLAWQRNVKRRNRLHDDVRVELGELSRSRPLIDIGSRSQAFVAALIDTAEQDRRRLESAVHALLGQATVLPTEPSVVRQAHLTELLYDLSPQDSIVYTTVIDHARRNGEPKVFVTQNANDFRVPQIEEELAKHGCKLLFTFDAAERYVRSEIDG